MVIFRWFILQILMLFSINLSAILISPSTYTGKSMLTYCIMLCIYLLIIFTWKTDSLKREKTTFKEYIACILLGIGLCLSHRIIFVIFPAIATSTINQMGMQTYYDALYSFKNPVNFILISMILPALEEILYRGKILSEFLKKNKPVPAVLLSTFLFAITHMNFIQFVSAACLGLVCGYAYIKCKNIKVPIMIHMTNNLYSSIMTVRIDELETYSMNVTSAAISIIIGFVLLLTGLKIVKK